MTTNSVLSEFANLLSRKANKIQTETCGPLISFTNSSTPSSNTQQLQQQLQPTHVSCKYLHICIEKGPYSTRMHHIDVCQKLTDRAIFQSMRIDYKRIRDAWFLKIERIDFVEVSSVTSTYIINN